MKIVFLTLLLSLVAGIHAQTCTGCLLCPPQKACGRVCRFSMCDAEGVPRPQRIIIRPPFAGPFNPTVCSGPEKIGFILKTGEPIVETKDGDFRISQYRLGKQIRPKFDKKFFLTQKVPLAGRSVIVRKPSKGNQEDFLDDLCIRLPILKYQRIRGRKTKAVRTNGDEADCVSYTTRSMQLFFEVLWESGDDLDLEVTQPNGETLTRSNQRSKLTGARFSRDIIPACSSTRPFGVESVKYFDCALVESGVYKVKVIHFSNCGDGPTKWTVRASLKGKIVFLKSGTSNGGSQEVIVQEQFTISD